MIRLLADENVPVPTIRKLRAAGIDVAAVFEDARGIPDRQVMQAAREQQRILLTFDRDFGGLIYQYGEPAPPGVVYVRVRADDEKDVDDLLLRIIESGEFELVGFFSVVERMHVRQRPLPPRPA